MKKKYSWKVQFTAFFIFFLLLASIALFSIELHYTTTKSGEFPISSFAYDETTIWRQVENYSFITTHRPDDHYEVTFNDRGFRDKNHKKQTSKEVRRIMVMGDSFAGDIMVKFEEAFPNVFGKQINQNLKDSFEVMTVGVPSWGLDQQFRYLRDEGIEYHPDYIFLMVTPNDIRETYCKKSLP